MRLVQNFLKKISQLSNFLFRYRLNFCQKVDFYTSWLILWIESIQFCTEIKPSTHLSLTENKNRKLSSSTSKEYNETAVKSFSVFLFFLHCVVDFSPHRIVQSWNQSLYLSECYHLLIAFCQHTSLREVLSRKFIAVIVAQNGYLISCPDFHRSLYFLTFLFIYARILKTSLFRWKTPPLEVRILSPWG